MIVTVSIATAALLINAIAWTIPEMHNIARYREKFLEFLSNAGENSNKKGIQFFSKNKIRTCLNTEFYNI